MLTNSIIRKNFFRICCYFLSLSILVCSCKKTENLKKEEPVKPVVFSYEVNCDYCSITYTDAFNQSKSLSNQSGKWTYSISNPITFEMKLIVKTTLSSAQTIQAYILKDGEVVHGNLGYNSANISYNTQKNTGSASFGAYTSSGSGGSTSTPVSSLCGAKNKTGGYCQRVVIGGGRCWQHK